ncbi:hypothetical protein SmJEL517_g05396 [Synchytrium microbalum]|uniref:alpha-1,2-Mannosidase n=1 Tax=Synchytrium microbalum TaxID=1806994 RepID=A0A507BUP6_9FUNG|nr:uncharacterized protein SmJEL517_g05396 [Synchytrium microbalum]TPX31272.1 hypothetical protein SmJEL517_g05396 [Synchytrium microbalum]
MLKSLQHDSNSAPSEQVSWKERSEAVVEAFRHAWKGYTKYAWEYLPVIALGMDELHPVSQRGSNWFGLGLTIIDTLDTALIMNQTDIFEQAREWVKTDLKFSSDENANVFEVTIRVLGGLLSTYHLSNDSMFLGKAVLLAEALMPAFSTESRVPLSSVNMAKKKGVAAHFSGGASSTAEVSTIQLEFKYLAQLTKNQTYWDLVEQVSEILEKLPKEDSLVPIFIDSNTGHFVGSEIRLGSRGDSYYEYLLKQYLLTNGTETSHKTQFDGSMQGVRKHLLGKTKANGLTFVGERPSGITGHFSSKMDHLVCFLPAVLALGATGGRRIPHAQRPILLNHQEREDLLLAEELTLSCYEMYRQTKTGLAPEIVHWITDSESASNGIVSQDGDFYIARNDVFNLLRPETVESLFTMWRITGDEKYREMGWNIFQSFNQFTRVETGGFSNIDDVTSGSPKKTDKMETFYLGETLKYLYLLFADENIIPLDQYVFNTEAHPFPIFTPPSSFTDSWKRAGHS